MRRRILLLLVLCTGEDGGLVSALAPAGLLRGAPPICRLHHAQRGVGGASSSSGQVCVDGSPGRRAALARGGVPRALASAAASGSATPEPADPSAISVTDAALRQSSVAPQWDPERPGAAQLSRDGGSPLEGEGPMMAVGGGDGICLDGTRHNGQLYAPRLPPLREEELEMLASTIPRPLPLTDSEWGLLNASIASIDYLGDWASPDARDSIVLTCLNPQVHDDEYTCAAGDFEANRAAMHSLILKRMLTSERTNSDPGASGGGTGGLGGAVTPRWPTPSGALADAPDASQQHVFVVVGVPGSGKSTVLKRYLRTLGLPLLDASADLIKEYLAAWGEDDFSQAVRESDALHGPGKQLLHAQYLHRESILLNDLLIEESVEEGRHLIVEKTLHDGEHVMERAKRFREHGCQVHLLGTVITPKKNWDFLEHRMQEGLAFGRYITKEQALSSLRGYHDEAQRIIRTPERRAVFSSIHLYDVDESRWCVSITNTSVRYADDPQSGSELVGC